MILHHPGDRFDGEGPREGREVADRGPVAEATAAQLLLDQEGELDGGGRALEGHRRDGDDEVASPKLPQRIPEPLRSGRRVEVVGRTRRDGTPVQFDAGGDDQIVEEDRTVLLQGDPAPAEVEVNGSIDDEIDPLPEQRSSRTSQPAWPGLIEGDVQPPGLIDVYAGGVDQPDRCLAPIEPLGEQIGGEEAANASSDHDHLGRHAHPPTLRTLAVRPHPVAGRRPREGDSHLSTGRLASPWASSRARAVQEGAA